MIDELIHLRTKPFDHLTERGRGGGWSERTQEREGREEGRERGQRWERGTVMKQESEDREGAQRGDRDCVCMGGGGG